MFAALALTIVVSVTGAPTLGEALPAGWKSDFGAPVAVDGGYIYLYGDPFTTVRVDGEDSRVFARNAVTLPDGTFMTNAIQGTQDGDFFWPNDAVQLPDGSLLIASSVVENNPDIPCPMCFQVVDSDAFVVNNPSDEASWQWKRQYKDVPWGDDFLQFSDQWDIAFTKDQWSSLTGERTQAWSYEPADPLNTFQRIETHFPESDGVFAPIQSASGWWGVTWHIETNADFTVWTNTVSYWYAETLDGEWTLDHQYVDDQQSHDDQLNLINGQVYHRNNNLDGDRRPHYERVTLS